MVRQTRMQSTHTNKILYFVKFLCFQLIGSFTFQLSYVIRTSFVVNLQFTNVTQSLTHWSNRITNIEHACTSTSFYYGNLISLNLIQILCSFCFVDFDLLPSFFFFFCYCRSTLTYQSVINDLKLDYDKYTGKFLSVLINNNDN